MRQNIFSSRSDVPGSINQHATCGRKCNIFIPFRGELWDAITSLRGINPARHQSSLATLPRTRIHIHSNVTSWRMAGEQGDWESSGRVVFFCACPSSTATTVWKRQAMPVYGLIDPFLFACFLPW